MMKHVKILFSLLFCFACLVSCSSDSSPTKEEPEELYSYQRILGKWVIYEWLNNGDFVSVNDDSFFSFYKGGEYVYYNALLDKHQTGKFGFDEASNIIHLDGDKDITIQATFSDDNHATFDWYYDISMDDITTIKVKRLQK